MLLPALLLFGALFASDDGLHDLRAGSTARYGPT